MTDHTALRNISDFDHPFRVNEDGEVTDAHLNVWAPEVYHSETNDIDIYGAGWEALTGYTGQYGYNGAVMHPSEYVGGGLARDILETPGVYVMVVVNAQCVCEPHEIRPGGFSHGVYCVTEQNAYCNFECECGADEEAVGWAILKRTA